MELLAIMICLSGFLSFSSAFKLVQKFPLEYQRPILQELSVDFGSILPYEDDEITEPVLVESEFNEKTILPRRHRRSSRNLRSLLNTLRNERKSVVNPLCFFTAIPCRSIRQSI